MKNRITSLLLLSLSIGSIAAQEKKINDEAKMQWFRDAKLGVFIHWGIYSVNGISESWSFFNNYINHDNYMKQLGGFNASRYNPDEWTKLIKESGAKYSVITTRHHDGISLWDSKSDKAITSFKDASAKEDLIAPFVADLKKAGLKTGLYYSLPDWSHPYYDVNTRTKKRYDIAKDPVRWQNFIKYYQGQLNELSTQFKPDLIWFDGDWEHTSAEWQAPQTLANLRKYNPNIIINSRLNNHGDYETPEQGIPVVAPQSKYWELCYTMNDSWGYQPFDRNYKSPNMIVRTLADVISMGGNLLIDIGPKADGSIPAEQVKILENLGRWTKKNSDAIYTTRQGLPLLITEGNLLCLLMAKSYSCIWKKLKTLRKFMD
nr:alpha-L-fucosidase [Elizabethkingia bruuniana]